QGARNDTSRAPVRRGVIPAYETPNWALPRRLLGRLIASAVPQPDASLVMSAEEAAMVERGRYLFTVASCAMCHGLGSNGGVKVSWAPFGTLWTRNITTD